MLHSNNSDNWNTSFEDISNPFDENINHNKPAVAYSASAGVFDDDLFASFDIDIMQTNTNISNGNNAYQNPFEIPDAFMINNMNNTSSAYDRSNVSLSITNGNTANEASTNDILELFFDTSVTANENKERNVESQNPSSIAVKNTRNSISNTDLMDIYKNGANINNTKEEEIDAFFDFGFTKKEPTKNNLSRKSLITEERKDCSSSNSESSSVSNQSDNNSIRKKREREYIVSNDKERNKSAFAKLHDHFDPVLLPLPAFTAIPGPKNKKLNKKRHSAPISPSMRKQLQKEGLLKKENKTGVNLQSPNAGKRLRQSRKEGKKQSKSPKTMKVKAQKKLKYNCLPELHRGTALLKYGRRGYPHFRQFNITEDNAHLRWFSQKKKMEKSMIHVKDINEVVTGQHTKEFRRISWNTLAPASFSVIYGGHKKSLNLVAKSVDEMKMWVEALRLLSASAKSGKTLRNMRVLEISTDFKDRNRPQSRNHSGKFLRSHETKEMEVDNVLQKKCIADLNGLRKLYQEINREASNPIVQSTTEFSSISQILSELEERIEELDHEIQHTRNTKIAENDVWRTRVDLESLREKIRVLNKEHKSSYYKTTNGKRRWSVF